jgi:hypothetical protein
MNDYWAQPMMSGGLLRAGGTTSTAQAGRRLFAPSHRVGAVSNDEFEQLEAALVLHKAGGDLLP